MLTTVVTISEREWPPKSATTLLSKSPEPAFDVVLRALPSGRFEAEFTTADLQHWDWISERHLFQPTTFEGEGSVELTLEWENWGERTNLFLNGIALESGLIAPVRSFAFPFFGDDLSEFRATRTAKEFLRRIAELDASVAKGDVFSLLQAGLVIHLLITGDDAPLRRVNALNKVKLSFRARGFPEDGILDSAVRPIGRHPILEMELWLSHPVLRLLGTVVTVQELFALCAGEQHGSFRRVSFVALRPLTDDARHVAVLKDLCVAFREGAAPLVDAVRLTLGCN